MKFITITGGINGHKRYIRIRKIHSAIAANDARLESDFRLLNQPEKRKSGKAPGKGGGGSSNFMSKTRANAGLRPSSNGDSFGQGIPPPAVHSPFPVLQLECECECEYECECECVSEHMQIADKPMGQSFRMAIHVNRNWHVSMSVFPFVFRLFKVNECGD